MLAPATVDWHPVIHTEMRLFTESVDIRGLTVGAWGRFRMR